MRLVAEKPLLWRVCQQSAHSYGFRRPKLTLKNIAQSMPPGLIGSSFELAGDYMAANFTIGQDLEIRVRLAQFSANDVRYLVFKPAHCSSNRATINSPVSTSRP